MYTDARFGNKYLPTYLHVPSYVSLLSEGLGRFQSSVVLGRMTEHIFNSVLIVDVLLAFCRLYVVVKPAEGGQNVARYGGARQCTIL